MSLVEGAAVYSTGDEVRISTSTSTRDLRSALIDLGHAHEEPSSGTDADACGLALTLN
jgi:hypothetical protein